MTPDVEIFYPDTFDIKDYPSELQFLQMAKASGVRSTTLMQEIDKNIADLILDDEKLARAHMEIENQSQPNAGLRSIPTSLNNEQEAV